VALAATCAAFGRGPAFTIISAILAGLALVTLIVHLVVDFDGTARAHAACATRLWQVREEYRALLSDLADGAIELDVARQRRDALMRQVHSIYEHATLTDQQAYQGAAQTIPMVDEGSVTDEEIDRLLPQSFRKSSAG
jgi:ABC-type transport system involved in cytochrome bd biosynthesis fused ATPase/permease subunit